MERLFKREIVNPLNPEDVRHFILTCHDFAGGLKCELWDFDTCGMIEEFSMKHSGPTLGLTTDFKKVMKNCVWHRLFKIMTTPDRSMLFMNEGVETWRKSLEDDEEYLTLKDLFAAI